MKHLVLRCWWLISFVFVAACFSPHFDDGQIMCGPNKECPPGLDCYGGVCRASDPGIDAATTYPLTITLGGNMNGTVTSSPAGIDCGTDCSESFMSGTMVTLTATPMTGSTFVGWSGACSGTGACTITVSTAVNVTANFAVDNSILVVLAGSGLGVVSSNPPGINCGSSCSYQFTPGTMVTLTALPATGSAFDGWTGAGCSGTGTCTVTADVAKMVTATFSVTTHALTVARAGTGTGTVTSAPTGINCGSDCTESFNYGTMVTLTAAPATGSTFTGWSGACTGTGTCMVTMTAVASVTATFTLTTHVLTVARSGAGTGTVTSTPTGINCGSDCTEAYDYNTMVTLSATPATGSTFAGWSGGGCSGTGPCNVTMTMATTVTAMFTLNTYNLSITKSGNGSGTVTSNPSGINCGADCAEDYNFGTMVTLTAMAGTGSTFAGWSGGICTGTAPCVVTVQAATDVTATFTLTTHLLTVTKNGTGSGGVTGIGISCGADCTETVDYNTMITLTATPAAGSTFDGWTGGGCTGTGSCQTTITMATTITATFTLTQHLLTVAKAGTGAGTVTSSPVGINCGSDCNELYDYGTMVTLTAAPATGSTFGGWSGGGCSGTMLMCTTTVTAAATVTATFTLTTQTLTVTKAGTGTGTVTSNIAGINCGADCTEPYSYGTMVTLSAVPDAGQSFTSWSGGGCTGNGTCSVTMTAATTVTATFSPTTSALSVTKTGTGAGTVTSNVGGINCGTTCSASIAFGTSVTLTATPAAGSTFTSWSGGACNGSTSTMCTFTLNSATTVNANFAITSHSLTITKAGSGTGGVTSSPAGINCGANCSASYSYGTSVTLTATPAANAVFTGWMGGGCTGTGTCVVTITTATTVTATFDLIQHNLSIRPIGDGKGVVSSNPAGIVCGGDCDENYNDGQMVMLTAVADPGSQFIGWTGDCVGTMPMCIVTVNADKGVFAEFEPVQYLLSVSNNPSGVGDVFSTSDPGISCGADCSELYDYNTLVTLKASEHSGYTFTGWTGACTGNGNCDLTMDMAKSVTANYVVTTYTLTVNRGGNGTGSVSSSPAGIGCGVDCTEDYTAGTNVTLTATPQTGTNFTSWSGAPGCSNNPVCTVTMSSVMNVTATFTLQQFSVNLTKAGAGTGTVNFSPGTLVCGPACSSAAASYNYNTAVTLTQSPSVGSTFAGWSGACTGTGNCNLMMTQVRNVTATYNSIPANKVFVTSNVYTPTALGGTSGADATCQSVANSLTPPLTGTWKAYLSSATSNVTDRIGNASGWVRTDGVPFANTKADLVNGKLFSPARVTQGGGLINNEQSIITGTTVGGVFSTAQGDCSNYSAAGTGAVITGTTHSGSYMFTITSSQVCNSNTGHLLCVQVDNQAAVTPPAPTGSFRRAFMRYWTPGGGLTGANGADTACQADATTNMLPGTYKAMLPTNGTTALSRFDTTVSASPWYRVDGMRILPSANAWTTASVFDSGPNLSADGQTTFANSGNWSGAASLTAAGTAASTCTDWTMTAQSAMKGVAGHVLLPTFLGAGGASQVCTTTINTIVCLQQ